VKPAGKPLRGRRILVTRPRHSGQIEEPLGAELKDLGAEVIWLPALEIGPPDDWGPLDRAIRRFASFDWIVFTSRNAVEGFADRLGTLGQPWSNATSLAAVGEKTAEALRRLGRTEVHVSPEPTASALSASLSGVAAGRRFLWPRAQLAPDLLAKQLLDAGATEVVAAACYQAKPAEVDAEPIRRALAEERIDAVAFTSARSVEATLQALGQPSAQLLSLVPGACIGPVTAEAYRGLGLGSPVVADGSLKGLVAVLTAQLSD
jgi:uroporphyrinogen III methyltransferase/synthase